MTSHRLLRLLALLPLTGAAFAQANVDPNIDVQLGLLEELDALGREGTFPNGVNAAAMSTTVCNQGDEVEWFAPMDPRHPFIAFLVARETNGRFQQISDRSFLKHGFFALTSSDCSPCTPPSGAGFGDYLGVGCSDTYSISSNGNDFWLGPADEIDPWLGEWDPVCSFFDLGLSGSTCNGTRSFSMTQANSLGPVGNRVRLQDADLNTPGAFWYQAQYVVAKEGEAVRNDNLGSRAFTPSWNGSAWDLAESGALLHGSVLQRWSGAAVRSATNAGDDGRVYVAAKVSGPVDGFYHYEFALHNRDNARGVREWRLPLCPGARVQAPWFGDLDSDAANDWSMSIESGGTELVFRDPSGTNPLPWNAIFNIAFDSDAAPQVSATSLVQAAAGPGASSFAVDAEAPVALFNAYTGSGCSLDGSPPTLFAEGSPPRATLGNASFALTSAGNVPGQLNVLVTTNAVGTGSIPIGGPCTFWLQGPIDQLYAFSSVTVDGSGRATHALPVPTQPFFEGVDLRFQCLGINPGGGGTFSIFDFSDGVEVRIGTSIPDCGS